MDFSFEITNHAGWIKELETLCDRLYNSDLGSDKERRVLGNYVYSRLPGQVQQPPGFHTCRQASFIIWHRKKTKDGNLAVKLFKKIKPAATHD